MGDERRTSSKDNRLRLAQLAVSAAKLLWEVWRRFFDKDAPGPLS